MALPKTPSQISIEKEFWVRRNFWGTIIVEKSDNNYRSLGLKYLYEYRYYTMIKGDEKLDEFLQHMQSLGYKLDLSRIRGLHLHRKKK